MFDYSKFGYKNESKVNWFVFGYINIIVIQINSCLDIFL
jgi:hypothetical protein